MNEVEKILKKKKNKTIFNILMKGTKTHDILSILKNI